MHLIQSTVLGGSNAKLDSNIAMPRSCDTAHTDLGSCRSHPHDIRTCCSVVLGTYPQKRQQKSLLKLASCTITMSSASRKTNREIGRAKSDPHLESNDDCYADGQAPGPMAIKRRLMQTYSTYLTTLSAYNRPCMKSSFSFNRLGKPPSGHGHVR